MSDAAVYVGSGAFPSRRLPDVLELAGQWGVSHLELSSDVAHHPEAAALARQARKHFSLLFHNYFPAPQQPFVINLAAADPEILELSRAHCRQALDLSAEVEAPYYAAHAGFTIQPPSNRLGHALALDGGVRREDAWRIFMDSVGMLLDYGRSRGVAFLIENNVVAPFNTRDGVHPFLLAEPEEILQAAWELGPDFGLLLDVAHLKVSAVTQGFNAKVAMEMIAGCTRAYHLSDNDGTKDNNRPFGADSWFLPLLSRALPATLEISCVDQVTMAGCLALLFAEAGPAQNQDIRA